MVTVLEDVPWMVIVPGGCPWSAGGCPWGVTVLEDVPGVLEDVPGVWQCWRMSLGC